MTEFVSPWNRLQHRLGGGTLVFAGLLVAFVGIAPEFAWIEYLTTAPGSEYRTDPVYTDVVVRSIVDLAVVAPVLFVGARVYAGRYGPLGLSLATPLVVVVAMVVNGMGPVPWPTKVLYPGWLGYGDHVEPSGAVLLVVLAWIGAILLLAVTNASFLAAATSLDRSGLGAVERLAWRLAWQPAIAVLLGLLAWWFLHATVLDGWPGLSALVVVLVGPWIACGLLVAGRNGTVREGFHAAARQAGADRLDEAAETTTLPGTEGDRFSPWPRRQVATTVAVGEDALQIADGCRLDVQTLGADLDPSRRELAYGRIDGVGYEDASFAVRTVDGTVYEFPCGERPDDLIDELDCRLGSGGRSDRGSTAADRHRREVPA